MIKNRRKLRKELMTLIYQHLLIKQDILTCLENSEIRTEDSFFIDIIELVVRNEKQYIKTLNLYLEQWTFDRLGKIEQAILLLASAEILGEINEKAVAINEAISLAKIFCEVESYKIINATLDKL